MKKERQDALLHLITEENISTQEMLRKRLAEMGFSVTQATLSRDIRELRLAKTRREGKLYYTAPMNRELSVSDGILGEAVLWADHAGHTAVIHCRSGTAPAVCVFLDALQREDVVGTIAGDDTVFVLMRTEALAREFVKFMGTGGF